MMIWSFIQVALGGAIGASLRYASVLGAARIFGTGFPIGTLLVNILGSLLMGFLVVLLDQKGWVSFGPFLTVGVLGGFTTFSAFSLEVFNLFQRGEPLALISYISLSIVLSVFALVLGIAIGRYLIV